MRSSGAGSTPLLVLLLVATAATSFLPAAWRVGWQRDLAAIVRVPLRPFTHAGNAAGAWLRPAPVRPDGAADDPDRAGMHEDASFARQRIAALEERVHALRRELRELQGFRDDGTGLRPRDALTLRGQVVSRGVSGRRGVVEVRTELRRGQAVPAGLVAVHATSAEVLGLVPLGLEGTGPVVGVVPVTSEDTGWITVTVEAADRDLGPPGGARDGTDRGDGGAGRDASRVDSSRPGPPRVRSQVKPDGQGSFVGDLLEEDAVAVGDIVRVDEDRWPEAARGLELGVVSAIRDRPGNPHVRDLVVTPRSRLRDVYKVLLVGDRIGQSPDGTEIGAAAPGTTAGATP